MRDPRHHDTEWRFERERMVNWIDLTLFSVCVLLFLQENRSFDWICRNELRGRGERLKKICKNRDREIALRGRGERLKRICNNRDREIALRGRGERLKRICNNRDYRFKKLRQDLVMWLLEEERTEYYSLLFSTVTCHLILWFGSTYSQDMPENHNVDDQQNLQEQRRISIEKERTEARLRLEQVFSWIINIFLKVNYMTNKRLLCKLIYFVFFRSDPLFHFQ